MMIGLRPWRSLRLPSTGENRNCISAYDTVSQPPIGAASPIGSPVSSITSLGATGSTMPMPIESMNSAIATMGRMRLRATRACSGVTECVPAGACPCRS